ncbi:MAG: YggT family protein [Actinomycetota bacterium]|jgi:YggT family protein
MIALLSRAIQLYTYVLFARAILSWFPASRGSIVEQISEILQRLTEPVLAPIRRVVPPIRTGAGYFDISIIIAVFGFTLLGNYI